MACPFIFADPCCGERIFKLSEIGCWLVLVRPWSNFICQLPFSISVSSAVVQVSGDATLRFGVLAEA